MKISVQKGDLVNVQGDVLILGMFQGQKEFEGDFASVNNAVQKQLITCIKEDHFTGELGKSYVFRPTEGVVSKRVLVVGCGKQKEFSLERVRQVSAASFTAVNALGAKHIVSTLHGVGVKGFDARACARAMAEGIELAGYQFSGTYQKKKKHKTVKHIDIVTSDGRIIRSVSRGIEDGQIGASGANFARDLVNMPSNDMLPVTLMETAKKIGSGKGAIRVRVYDREKLEKMGAGSLLAVAKGAETPPYLVHMIYTPKGKMKKKVCLVGKAVTFDSGGLSLKPANFMETMKVDMGGSAVVLGVFSVIDRLAPKAEVHGIFGAVENMPSGKAMRPGDVVTAMNKKTIEVLNTDAEGRLTLADTLTYATKQKPDFIIDLATLTGACVVALGEEISAVMSNNNVLSEQILSAAKVSDEKMWPLPLEQNYRQLLKSDIADLKNIGGHWGGAITAGLFLKEFVGEIPWAHIDIAGPTFAERPIDAYTPKGGTGHAVRTMLELLRSI
jgi:leucyl aminopeptidase